MAKRQCPSFGAREDHLKRGEPVCDECREFFNAYQRACRRGETKRRICVCCGGGINRQTDPEFDMCFTCRRRNGKPPRCGTLRGFEWHLKIRHEEPCSKCYEVKEKYDSGLTICINPKCGRKVVTKSDYCGRCKEGTIIGWMVHKGVRKPIYHIKGGTHVPRKEVA